MLLVINVRTMTKFPLLLFGFALASLITLAEAVVVANYTAPTNLRFENNESFLGNDFDLSGVGRLSRLSPADQAREDNPDPLVNPFREGTWATALGPNYFLSANHYQPDAGSEITFFPGNDSSATPFTYQVSGGFRVGTTDLWIGYTVTEIDMSIARYGFVTTPANSLADTGLAGRDLYMSGDLLAGRLGTITDHVLAHNQAESFYNEGSGSFFSPVLPPGSTQVNIGFTPPAGFENDMIILFNNDLGDDAAPLVHEAELQGGDSGSPLFVADGSNTLTIVGVSSLTGAVSGNFIDTPGPPNSTGDPIEQRGTSFYTYTGSYVQGINDAIALVPAPVPEPSLVLVIGLGFALGLRRRRYVLRPSPIDLQ